MATLTQILTITTLLFYDSQTPAATIELLSRNTLPFSLNDHQKIGFETPSFSKAKDGFIFGTILVVNDPPATMDSDSLTSEVQ
jgi:hypothetical protein